MENLFDDIPESNKQQWITQVTKDLKGADFNEKLIHTVAGIEIQPLYTKDDIPEYVHDTADDFFAELDPEFSDGGTDDSSRSVTWNICEDITMHENEILNDLVIESLKRGSNYIRLSAESDMVWDIVVDHIRKLKHAANFALNVDGDLTKEEIVGIWRERIGFIGDRDRLVQSLEFDPIGYWLETGNIVNENKSFNNLADLFFRISGHLQDCKLLKIEYIFKEEVDVVEQLANTLAITSDYFDQLTERNVPLEELIHLITFRFTIGSNYFLEIAKLRAFKVLWNNLLKTFMEDIDFIPNPYIHVSTSKLNLRGEDKHSNLLRTTTEAMSAVLGGCDVLSVCGYDPEQTEPDAFAKRSATHIQNLMRYETHLDSYRDAANGSFYIENITTQIAEKAWLRFLEIENEGGFLSNWKEKNLNK